tara:strand:+ start:19005 stop:19193 length:189 start_codon:yes stop_codon:yes gene_type:complete
MDKQTRTITLQVPVGTHYANKALEWLAIANAFVEEESNAMYLAVGQSAYAPLIVKQPQTEEE